MQFCLLCSGCLWAVGLNVTHSEVVMVDCSLMLAFTMMGGGFWACASCLHSSYLFLSVLHTKSLQSCLTLCDSVDRSPPGSSVHGISQARILDWVAMPSPRGSSRPRDWAHVSTSPTLVSVFFPTSTTWWTRFGLSSNSVSCAFFLTLCSRS